jgi:hypothetical protein
LKSRSVEVLPCRYFHLIATIPSELRRLFLRHQKTLYGLLMKTVAESVRDLADEALAQSSLESDDHSVKCPKCGGTNVLRLETIRRRKANMVTGPMGEQ